MIIFIDDTLKRCFICSPKCGNQTIAKYLNVELHHPPFDEHKIIYALTHDEYTKIIIVRNVYDRFLSGLNEDIHNNLCFNDVHISFKEYCKFLYHCHMHKIANVFNLNVYNSDINVPINWGECSNEHNPITDNFGNISGHLISQKQSISVYVNMIVGMNVQVIDINELNTILGIGNIRENVKNGISNTYTPDTLISHIKHNIDVSNSYMISHDMLLDESILSMVSSIYKDDIDYIYYLKLKYNPGC